MHESNFLTRRAVDRRGAAIFVVPAEPLEPADEGRNLRGREDADAPEATDVRDRASDEAGLATMEGSKVVGEQTVAAAASGVDSSSGTAADIAEASRVNAALDSQTIRNNAAREAWGLKIQALQVQQEGKRARRASEKGAVGTVLGGLGSVSRGIYGLAG